LFDPITFKKLRLHLKNDALLALKTGIMCKTWFYNCTDESVSSPLQVNSNSTMTHCNIGSCRGRPPCRPDNFIIDYVSIC